MGALVTLCAATCWGVCGVVSKYLMNEGITALWLVDFRLLLAGVLMLGYAQLKNGNIFRIWSNRASVIRLLIISIFGFAINQLAYYLCIHYCNAGIATALEQTAPVLVLLTVIIKERRLPRIKELVVLALVIFGSFMIATGGDFGELAIPLAALIWGGVACLTCCIYTLMPGELIANYGNFETSGWCLFIGGLVMAPFAQIWQLPVGVNWNATLVISLLFVTIVGSVAAFGLYLYGTTLVGPARASIYGLFETVVATFASLVFLGQAFSLADYIGIASILIGIFILSIDRIKK